MKLFWIILKSAIIHYSCYDNLHAIKEETDKVSAIRRDKTT